MKRLVLALALLAAPASAQTIEPVGKGYAIHKPGEPTVSVQPDGRGGWTSIQQGRPTIHADPAPSPRGGTEYRVWSNQPGSSTIVIPPTHK
jgi:hypothetical protein